jgi:hypothetical protein
MRRMVDWETGNMPGFVEERVFFHKILCNGLNLQYKTSVSSIGVDAFALSLEQAKTNTFEIDRKAFLEAYQEEIMDSTVAGLIGAAIGALAAIASALATSMLQERQERKKWQRDKKQEAYANSLRYILRALNKRSKIDMEQGAILGEDGIKEWFDDISEVQIWLTTLSIYCPPAQRGKIIAVLDEVRAATEDFMTHSIATKSLPSALSSAYTLVSASERADIDR